VNYYERHIGDWIKDTVALSMLEDGAYNRLIDQCYQTEKPLPRDKKEIFRAARANSKAEKDSVLYVLGKFFEETPDGYVQKRVELELARYVEKKNKAQASANARWNKAKEAFDQDANASETHGAQDMRTHYERNAHQSPVTSNQLTTSTNVLVRAEGSAPAKPPSSKIPDCPHQKVLALWSEVLPQLPQHTEWGPSRSKHLQARWREKAAEKSWANAEDGLLFFKKLFAYIGKSPFLTGQSRSNDPSRPPFVIELEWLIKPTNWAKVIEGKYHTEA
jgi:uncharacterized protein YdaU (DUF1376 family)